MTKDDSDLTQLWVTSDYGQQLINVGTNLPFQAHEGRSWIWDEEGKVLIDARKPNKVVNFKFIVFNKSFIPFPLFNTRYVNSWNEGEILFCAQISQTRLASLEC